MPHGRSKITIISEKTCKKLFVFQGSKQPNNKKRKLARNPQKECSNNQEKGKHKPNQTQDE